MPIKLPKGFPRRKSSGNVLDEVSSPREQSDGSSSFKVLARPQSMGKSLDGSSTVRVAEKRPQPPPKSSFELDNEDLFSVVRGDAPNRSSDTTNSLITLPNDSTASSRYSNSSTNPSSVDSGSARNVKPIGQRFYEDAAVQGHASKPSFLKNAGRTFSFGIGKHNTSKDMSDVPPLPTDAGRRTTISSVQQRERSMTESSASTAAPPRLDDHTFSIKATGDDDFGNMFAHLGSKSSRENLSSRPGPSASRAAPPRPIHVNKNATIETSLPSWNSQGSRDGLIGSSSPARTVIHDSPNFTKPSNLRNPTMDTIRSEASQDDNIFENTPLHRSPEPEVAKPYSSPRSRAPPSAFPSSAMTRARTQSTGNSSIQKSDIDASEYDQPAFDPSLLANAQLASQYEHRAHATQQTPQSKVMTPAEFERYKQQKEDTRKYNKVFGKADSDDGSGDDYDDDEEDQREREQAALKQRKKQEAHLAVYRQQMMKVTGDAAPAEARPGTSMSGALGNTSQLDLSLQERRMSQMTLNPAQYGALGRLPIDAEPDEDEDVPLGILAAHGFPNKNKPPTRLLASSSNPNLRNLAQTQGGASVVGAESNRGSLPAFARHLPVDPYYGASLVHQAERTPISMHGNMSSPHLATQPQPSGAATAHPLHPAGLVGVIAGEERARAIRRGSPNPQTGQFDAPMAPSQSMRNIPQQMNPYQPPGMMMPQQMISPAEQAQLQMSQSMTQMMQMQMQWMQQMSSIMGQNPNMPMSPMMGMPGMPQMPQMQQNGVPMMPGQQPQHPGLPHRPQSVPLQGHLPTHRTMSSLSPSMAGWNNSSPAVPQFNPAGSVYAPSIAPSERSNVGLAPRYRPVATGTQEPPSQPTWQKRSSTFSSATFRPWTTGPSNSKPSVPTIRSVNQQDDDDDEQGWAEMKARKETKQKSWRLRKGGNNTLKELYNAPV